MGQPEGQYPECSDYSLYLPQGLLSASQSPSLVYLYGLVPTLNLVEAFGMGLVQIWGLLVAGVITAATFWGMQISAQALRRLLVVQEGPLI